MKKRTRETIFIGAGLVVLSLFLHYVHFLIFRDAHHTLIFLFADIAFIPMEVFFTTLIIDKLLEKREKDHFLEKLNMLIGVFYTEIGTKILNVIVKGDENINLLKCNNLIKNNWTDSSFIDLEKNIAGYDFNINIDKIDIDTLKNELTKDRDFLMNLISSENLHEHETFTEMIMSLMHLKEEIDTRCCEDVEKYEMEHIAADLSIAYRYLTIEWCQYMKYLSKNYPRLFVKALINNPFDNRDKRIKDSIYLLKQNK